VPDLPAGDGARRRAAGRQQEQLVNPRPSPTAPRSPPRRNHGGKGSRYDDD
jgi:hypothetical protein